MPYKIIKADIMAWLEEYQGEPFHAALFDPPYHLTSIVERFNKDEPEHTKTAKDIANRSTPIARLAKGFMGKNWDGGDLIFQPETWQLLSTVLHPGAFVMAYCSSRGWHRQAVAMEDGGFTFHPSIALYSYGFGSGFPKATRIRQDGEDIKEFEGYRYGLQLIKPATEFLLVGQKPLVEPILVGQKPYQGKPVENIVQTGAGAINVDGGRVGTDDSLGRQGKNPLKAISREGKERDYRPKDYYHVWNGNTSGRWPSSLILHHLPECKRVGTKKVRGESGWSKTGSKSGANVAMSGPNYERQPKQDNHTDSDGYETVTEWQCAEGCPVKIVGEQSGERPSGDLTGQPRTENNIYNTAGNTLGTPRYYKGDTGTAARYFKQPDWSYEIYEQLNNADLLQYITKPSTTEREAGLEKLPFGTRNRVNSGGYEKDEKWRPVERKNTHPTVKSIALNKYLATLLLPPPEYAPRRILVPFCGSGSEVIGCLLASWDEVIGIELENEYYDIASERVAWWYGVMESCNYDVDNIIEHWQEEQKLKESGQMRLL